MVWAPRGLPGPEFGLPWPAGGQGGWPSRRGHFSGPGGRTAARVPFPRVRFRPLCRGVAKSGPHDLGGYPGRNFARGRGAARPAQRKKKVEGYPSSYRSVVQENRRHRLTRTSSDFPSGGFAAAPATTSGTGDLEALHGRAVEHDTGLLSAHPRSALLADYAATCVVSSIERIRGQKARSACSSCTRH